MTEVYVKTDQGFKEVKLSQEKVGDEKPEPEQKVGASSAPEKEEPECDTDTFPENDSKIVKVSQV